MALTRRDFLAASSALAAAWGIKLPEAVGATTANNGPSVVWLQAQACTGCSVSFLNTIYYGTVDSLLTTTLKLQYHPTLMAAAGDSAVAVAQAARDAKGYVLIVEGAIPTASNGAHCYLWPGLTAMKGVQDYAANASQVIAVGTCASFGGCPSGKPNPTAVQPLSKVVAGVMGTKKVINIPGCPTHPDWVVGAVAYLIKNGAAPPLDSLGRPTTFFGRTVHSMCPYNEDNGGNEDLCLEDQGCKGKSTYADCPSRKWNGGAANTPGVNWCCTARTPCFACTQPTFPDSSIYSRLSSTTSTSTSSSNTQPTDTATTPPADTPAPQPQPKPTYDGHEVEDHFSSTTTATTTGTSDSRQLEYLRAKEARRVEYELNKQQRRAAALQRTVRDN